MHYDICDPEIRCNADKADALVFEVYARRKIVRILTFSQERAEEIAREATPEPVRDEGEFLF